MDGLISTFAVFFNTLCIEAVEKQVFRKEKPHFAPIYGGFR